MTNTKELDAGHLMLTLVKVIARAAIPVEHVRKVVGNRPKQIRAYNLLDGSQSLSDVARKTKIEKGNLSKATQRWLSEGVMYRLGSGRDAKLLHAYPIAPIDSARSRPKSR